MVPTLHSSPTCGLVTPPSIGFFPICMYAIAKSKEASIADVWNKDNGYWSSNFRRNFKEEEILKWASLSHLIPFVVLTQASDSWVLKLDNSGVFTTNSLCSLLLAV